MSVKEGIQHLAQNPKVAGVVSGATTGTGVGTILDLIPDDIGKLATLVGIILSVILIRLHLVSLRKAQFELQVMKTKEAERLEAAEQRKKQGQPLRRESDS